MTKRRRQKNEIYTDEVEGASSDWMTTYADMATLLMTFFIILSTMLALKIDPTWLAGKEYIEAKSREEKPIENPINIAEIPDDQLETVKKIEQLEESELTQLIAVEEIEELGRKMEQYIIEEDMQDFVSVDIDNWKVTIVPLVPFLFTPGRAVIRPEGREFLARMADFLELNDVQVRISGHTDNIPIHNYLYPSNWELSSQRAIAVMRYFVDNHEAPPTRFSAIGFGEYHPVASNDTPEGRARNRRVEIQFVQRTDDSEPLFSRPAPVVPD